MIQLGAESPTLKFFTRELYDAAYRADRWEEVTAANDAYGERLTRVGPLLGSEVFAVADPFFVADALIAKVRQSDSPAQLQVVLRCGDIRAGYFDLGLTYHDPDITDDDLRALANVAAHVRGSRNYGMMDAWCHEVDLLPDGRIEHHLTFHGPTEVNIRCSSLTVVREDRANRLLPPYPQRSRIARLG